MRFQRSVLVLAAVALATLVAVPSRARAQSCPNWSQGGPYRKLIAKAGYRKIEGYVALPSSANISIKASSGDGAYNHVGGTGNKGSEVDAGVYYKAGQTGFRPFMSTWDALSGQGSWTDGTLMIPLGTQVFLRFYIPSDNQVTLYVQYTDSSGMIRSEQISKGVSGFPQNGSGVYLKRVTSIAQPTPGNKGSYQLNVRWGGVTLFTTTASQLWTSTQTHLVCVEPEHGIEDASPYVVAWTTTNPYYDEVVSVDTRNFD